MNTKQFLEKLKPLIEMAKKESINLYKGRTPNKYIAFTLLALFILNLGRSIISTGTGSKVNWAAYTNYNINQICRLQTPNTSVGGSMEAVALILMDARNPYYDDKAAAEYLLMTKDGPREASEIDKMNINIFSGIIKKCPDKIYEKELFALKALVNYYKKNNKYCLQFDRSDKSMKTCAQEG